MRFLRAQLESIAGQTLPPGELVVCDDCSSDGTPDLVEEFAARVHFPVRLYRNDSRLGVLRNYTRAAGLCRGDYAAFCDQDDVWLPDKLELSAQGMREAELAWGKDTPLLLHTDLTAVDSGGKVIAPSFMKLQNIRHEGGEPLKTLLVQNFVTGCTVLLNRPLLRAALPVPERALMHDWWFALVAAALGELVFIPRPTVLYRQHSGNVVGAKKYLSGKNMARLARIGALEREIARTILQGRELKKRLEQVDCTSIPGYLPRYLEAARQGGKKAAVIARSHGIVKQGRVRRSLFLMLLYKAGYLKYLEEDRAAVGNHR